MMRMTLKTPLWLLALALAVSLVPGTSSDAREKHYTPEGELIPYKMIKDWPQTDFNTYEVPLFDFIPGGPRKDEMPAINNPKFRAVEKDDADNLEPVVSITIEGEARAYPFNMLLWHEVVNDEVSGVPIVVTLSPLTGAVRVFRRAVEGEVTIFGTSGLLRHAGQVIYDKKTHSWWQQFIGRAVFGTSTGQELETLPARIESLAAFAARQPEGQILTPNIKGRRPYGRTPLPRYDSAKVAVHYKGDYRGPVPPMARVVMAGGQAWSLDLVRREKTIETADLRIRFIEGMNSPYDKPVIRKSRDIGFVTVEERAGDAWVDAVYDMPFAFAIHAFHPDHPVHH